MSASERLHRLIALNAPFWAGEAEVFKTYWTWEGRSRETDKTWLGHQCFKEIWGSGVGDKQLGLFMGPLKQLEAMFPKIDLGVDRHEALDIAEGFWAEFAHYCAFADAFDGMCEPGEEKMHPNLYGSWPADDRLGTLRYEHREKHGDLGWRACRFTEGGYCTLFSEGMALKGNGGRDDLIAEGCSKVYDDEFGHMLKGVVGLDDENMTDADWDLLEELSIAQMKLRIHMRNDQFGQPLGEKRIAEIYAGEIEPLEFDWEGAKLAA